MSYGKCHECKKFGTVYCPTSSKCLAFDERPFFEPKKETKSGGLNSYLLFTNICSKCDHAVRG